MRRNHSILISKILQHQFKNIAIYNLTEIHAVLNHNEKYPNIYNKNIPTFILTHRNQYSDRTSCGLESHGMSLM